MSEPLVFTPGAAATAFNSVAAVWFVFGLVMNVRQRDREGLPVLEWTISHNGPQVTCRSSAQPGSARRTALAARAAALGIKLAIFPRAFPRIGRHATMDDSRTRGGDLPVGTVTVLHANRTDCHHDGDPAGRARRGFDGDPCGSGPQRP